MKIEAYISRALDYIPFVSIAKGIYYINKANDKEKFLNNIVQKAMNEKKNGKITAEQADVKIEYANINKTKIDAIHFRGAMACIPIIGNLFNVIHDIKGHFIKGGYPDSMDEMTKWNI